MDIKKETIITEVNGVKLFDNLDDGIVVGFDLNEKTYLVTDCKEGWSVPF